jgi:predicted dithiol-disulfide oxidoreductase (DUF899 family)
MNIPQIVTQEEWQAARDELLVKEKAATRALDALAAERRRLPMVQIEKNYELTNSEGATVGLGDLFEGRRQLVIYHFMYHPDAEEPCTGCASWTDNIGNLAHLHARDTTLALVSRAPIEKLNAFQERMGWDKAPWYSSHGSDFNVDFGVTFPQGEMFGLSALLMDENRIFRSYFTSARGSDRLRMDFNLLDMTPLGRQETWEDSPAGWPQTEPYQWWRLHDKYENQKTSLV